MIKFVNEKQNRKKNPTVSSGNYLEKETIKINQLQSQPKLQSKDKE